MLNKSNNVCVSKFILAIKSLLIGVLAWLFSIFLYSPRFAVYFDIAPVTRRNDLLKQCLDPLTRTLNEPILAYRLVQPLIAHLLGFCGSSRDFWALLGSPGIAYAALILTLASCHWALRQRFGSATTLLAVFGLATTMVTQWTNTEWGHPDSLTLLPISLMLISRHPMFVLTCVFIGSVNDERLILALPFILLWWWPPSLPSRDALRRLYPQILACLLGLAATLLFRIALSKGLIGPGIGDVYGGGDLFDDYLFRIFSPSTWLGLVVTVFLGYRWLWIFPLLVISSLWRGAPSMRTVVYLISMLLAGLATFTVNDVSRSFAFFFPSLVVALQLLSDEGFTEAQLSRSLGWCLALNVLTPAGTIYFVPSQWWVPPFTWVSPFFPLPLNLWECLKSLQSIPE